MNDFVFDESKVLHKIKHYLPSQLALKDFVHHNTLHAFQDLDFFEALQVAGDTFGYRGTLSIAEYQALYHKGTITDQAITAVLCMGSDDPSEVLRCRDLMHGATHTARAPFVTRIGHLRRYWKVALQLDIDTITSHSLFKIVASYLDQGISKPEYRGPKAGLLAAVRALDRESVFKVFHSQRVRDLLHRQGGSLSDILAIIVGDERYYEQYLFDQQFAHPGWSGFVAVAEDHPEMLHDQRMITFREYVYLELLLELDVLDRKLSAGDWLPIVTYTDAPPMEMISDVVTTEAWQVKRWWQEAFELTYFDQVIAGACAAIGTTDDEEAPSFQAFFCIDDREESIRRHIEALDPAAETFGTPAHYGLVTKYRPKGGKFNAHVCPAPAVPRHVITDDTDSEVVGGDRHFHKTSQSLLGGWMLTQTLGFWSAVKLFVNLFKPSISAAHSSSFEHMSHKADPNYEHVKGQYLDGFQVGYTVEEMVDVVGAELQRTGLVAGFAPIVYLFGHGGSSTNNPYYAGYNCGACAGKPSSLNARVFARMANRQDVRTALLARGIEIPATTVFVGGLHDTTRDVMVYYDIDDLSATHAATHTRAVSVFTIALGNNAKERARQFIAIDVTQPASDVHRLVERRSMSLFETRPELNHSNNCLCIVARRQVTRRLFLDQRAFLNSYDYRLDPDGRSLAAILGAATPVCGGINLEYYFSRVDNEKLGSGSKLPHNVVGLFGVANGVEGDLRTGLPSQMIEVHDPLRLMMVVVQSPAVVEQVLKSHPSIGDWYARGWQLLTVIDPTDASAYSYRDGRLMPYQPYSSANHCPYPIYQRCEETHENLPVYTLN